MRHLRRALLILALTPPAVWCAVAVILRIQEAHDHRAEMARLMDRYLEVAAGPRVTDPFPEPPEWMSAFRYGPYSPDPPDYTGSTT